MASQILVPDSIKGVISGFNKTPDLPRTSAIPKRECHPLTENSNLIFGGLEDFRGGDTTKLSKTSLDLHQHAWRPGKQIAYKSAWGKWASWCSVQSVNPFQNVVANIIDFLTKLFSDGLQYRTINTYISAIKKLCLC